MATGSTFQCVSMSVTPVKSQYATDEQIELRVQGETWRKYGGSLDMTTIWATDFYLASTGELLDSVEHGRVPGQMVNSSGQMDFILRLGPITHEGIFNDSIIVKAHDVYPAS